LCARHGRTKKTPRTWRGVEGVSPREEGGGGRRQGARGASEYYNNAARYCKHTGRVDMKIMRSWTFNPIGRAGT
jgi:hypothetical protein